MRSRAGFFWCSLWLTLLLLLPLILVVGFLARQRQTQQELRQAAANQSQLQIEPGAQSVWRMLLVVQKEEPAFVLVRADGPAHSVTFCALPGQLLVNAPAGTTTLAECTLSAGAGRAAQLLRAALSTGETALPPLYYLAATPSCWVDCVGSGTAVRFDTSSLLQPAARLALGYGKEAVQAVSATDAVELIADLQSQMTGRCSFPHEIGFFLGYPYEDVIGFIDNEGENFLCSGCWKVYAKERDAQTCFCCYKNCTTMYQQLFDEGVSIECLAAVDEDFPAAEAFRAAG